MRAIVVLAAVASAAAGSVDGDSAATKPPPRGVDPVVAASYQGTQFVCDGGAVTLDPAKINDEYCDCKDGTDEPGACAREVKCVCVSHHVHG